MSSLPASDGRRRRRVSDERILAAAVSEFAAYGFAGASISRIAERARTTRPTIYANFGTKEALFADAMQGEADALRTTLLGTYARIAGDSVSDQLRAGSRAIFDFAAARPDGFRLLFGGALGLPINDPALHSIYEDIINAVAAMIRGGLTGDSAARRAREYAVMVVGLLSATARDTIEGGADPAVAEDAAVGFLIGAFSRVPPDLATVSRASVRRTST